MVKSGYIGDGHPTVNRNPYNGYINLYYWVDDKELPFPFCWGGPVNAPRCFGWSLHLLSEREFGNSSPVSPLQLGESLATKKGGGLY